MQHKNEAHLLNSLESLEAQTSGGGGGVNQFTTQKEIRQVVNSMQTSDDSLSTTAVTPTQLRLAMLRIDSKQYTSSVPICDHELVDSIIANAVAINAPGYGQGAAACYSLGAVLKGNYDQPSRIRVLVTPTEYSLVLSGYQNALDVAVVYRRLNMAFSSIMSVKMSIFPHDAVSGNDQIGIEIRMCSAGLRSQESDADTPSLMSSMQKSFDQNPSRPPVLGSVVSDTSSTEPSAKKRSFASSLYNWFTA